MASYLDIKWIKSVKHKKGTGWAYFNYKKGDEFNLNWPKGNRYNTNAERPQIGEIIVLFQKVYKKLHSEQIL